jgi:hypothetical protein
VTCWTAVLGQFGSETRIRSNTKRAAETSAAQVSGGSARQHLLKVNCLRADGSICHHVENKSFCVWFLEFQIHSR